LKESFLCVNVRQIKKLLIDIFQEYPERHNVILEKANGEEVHMHFLFKASPNIDFSIFINVLKI